MEYLWIYNLQKDSWELFLTLKNGVVEQKQFWNDYTISMSTISEGSTISTSNNNQRQKIEVVIHHLKEYNRKHIIHESIYKIIEKELNTTVDNLLYLEQIYEIFASKPSTNEIINDHDIIESLDSPLRMLGLGSLVESVESFINFEETDFEETDDEKKDDEKKDEAKTDEQKKDEAKKAAKKAAKQIIEIWQCMYVCYRIPN